MVAYYGEAIGDDELGLMPVDEDDVDMGVQEGVLAKVKRLLTRVRRGLTIDSGAAEHVIPPHGYQG